MSRIGHGLVLQIHPEPLSAEESKESDLVSFIVQGERQGRIDERPPVLPVRPRQQRNFGLDLAVLEGEVRVERKLVIAKGGHPRKQVMDWLWYGEDGHVLLNFDQSLEVLGPQALGDAVGAEAPGVINELPVILVAGAILDVLTTC